MVFQGKNTEIQRAVLQLLQEILDDPAREFQPSDCLVEDLNINSDVLSFEFAIPLMRKFNVDVPGKAWLEVHTIQDVIDFLARYQGN